MERNDVHLIKQMKTGAQWYLFDENAQLEIRNTAQIKIRKQCDRQKQGNREQRHAGKESTIRIFVTLIYRCDIEKGESSQ